MLLPLSQRRGVGVRSMKNKLHIISLDIPFPANYGGVIDIFYKLKSLSNLGVEIILHCFEYGDRKPTNELNKYCKQVFYYKRKTGFAGLDATLPYLVSSRNNKQLLKNLLVNNSPILFEGIHTTYLLNHPSLKNRQKIIRTHNIESEYYQHLARHEKSYLKKLYYAWESMRLISYENKLQNANVILSISKSDAAYFSKKYPTIQTQWVPAFHGNNEVSILEGRGNYCLYHGNLDVAENKQAIDFLVNEVFVSDMKITLIISGKTKSNTENRISNIVFIENPSDEKLQELIQDAQINILPSMQVSGIKLKLLHALFNGRFCLVNDAMLVGSDLFNSIHVANSSSAFKQKINELMTQSFTTEMIDERKNELVKFDNEENAKLIITNL
jgi:hypothetical protein